MSKKLVLGNQSQINIESGSTLSVIKVNSMTKEDMLSTWDMLTEENLKHIEIQSEDGTITGAYNNILLNSETSIIQSDGTIMTNFHLREKTTIELLQERVEQLENGQEVLDGAVVDLGAAVSELAAEGGLA